MAQSKSFGLHTVGTYVSSITEPAFSRHSSELARLLAAWPDVVGERFQNFTRPLDLKFQGRERMMGTLHLAVEPAFALELQHQLPQFIDRINAYFGFSAVAQVKMIQQYLPRDHKPAKLKGLPDARARGEADKMVAGIEESPLRDLLADWGAEILGKK